MDGERLKSGCKWLISRSIAVIAKVGVTSSKILLLSIDRFAAVAGCSTYSTSGDDVKANDHCNSSHGSVGSFWLFVTNNSICSSVKPDFVIVVNR
ncbi:hypothetical protein Tco_0470963 [Tanacetum coccineum]